MAGGSQAMGEPRLAKKVSRNHGPTPVDGAMAAAIRESHMHLLRFLRRRIGEGADEVLRAFFMQALEEGPRLAPPETLRTKLVQVMAHVASDHFRRRAIEGGTYPAVFDGHQSSALTDEEAGAAVAACLYALLPTVRAAYGDVFWRVDLAGEPRRDTARVLGTTPNNLGVRLYRARGSVLKRLEQACLTCPHHGLSECGCDYATAMREALRGRPRSGGKPSPGGERHPRAAAK